MTRDTKKQFASSSDYDENWVTIFIGCPAEPIVIVANTHTMLLRASLLTQPIPLSWKEKKRWGFTFKYWVNSSFIKSSTGLDGNDSL